MARKEGKISTHRLPESYGDPESAPLHKMNMTPARQQSKENAAGSPHPEANNKYSRACSPVHGSETLGVKQEHFNDCREDAHNMSRKSY
jgi:hypothetical protein